MDDQTQDEQKVESVDDVVNNMNSPATREQLVAAASEAPEHVRAQIEALPEGEYYKPEDLNNALRTGVGPQDENSDS